jgi:hypothetical protein
MQIRRMAAANSLYAVTPFDRVEEQPGAVALHDIDES